MTEYRRAVREDKAAIIDFINMVFSVDHNPHNFKTLIPKVYGDEACMWAEHYIAVQDGIIVGCVAMLPIEMEVYGEKLKIGIIGSVSVHPYHRSEGHMKKCMAMMQEDADRMGLQLQYLGGIRQRYEYFGFSVGGVGVQELISCDNIRHGLKNVDASAITFVPVAGYEHECASLHAALPVRAIRAEEDFAVILRSWDNAPCAVLKNGAFVGYLVGDEENISEMVLADEADNNAVLKAWSLLKGSRRLKTTVPVWNTARLRAFNKLAEHSVTIPLDNFRIQDWESVIRVWLKAKAASKCLTDGRFVLEVEGKTIAIEVCNNAVSVCAANEKPDAVLGRLDAQDLLLADNRYTDTSDMPACVENWFPLPVSIIGTDGF